MSLSVGDEAGRSLKLAAHRGYDLQLEFRRSCDDPQHACLGEDATRLGTPLRELFGFDAFRPGQEEAIRAANPQRGDMEHLNGIISQLRAKSVVAKAERVNE